MLCRGGQQRGELSMYPLLRVGDFWLEGGMPAVVWIVQLACWTAMPMGLPAKNEFHI